MKIKKTGAQSCQGLLYIMTPAQKIFGPSQVTSWANLSPQSKCPLVGTWANILKNTNKFMI
jgi:hypothetical protein